MMKSSYEELNEMQLVSESDPFTEDRYRQFTRYLPKNCRTVLDVGCNTGRGGSVLKSICPSLALSGLDCVESRLERLPEAYEKKVLGLSTDIPSADYSFDAITAGEFVEHLAPRDVDITLNEFFRVLKIGGRLLLTTPNPSSWVSRLKGRSVLGGSHLTQHHADCLRLRLRMTGFSSVKVYGSGKSSRYIGMHIPVLGLYGSYMIVASKC